MILLKLKIYVTIFIFFLSCNTLAQQTEKSYSLADLYQIALETSEKIKISEENTFLAETQKEKALSVLMPRASAFWSHTKYSEEKTVEGSLIQPDWRANWGLRLDQSFTLNGKELTAFRIAQDDIQKNQYDLYAVKEAYLFSVASAYYDVLRTKETVEIAESNVKRLKTHLNAVEIRLKLEEVTKTALYRAKAELSKSKTDLISAKNSLKLGKALLSNVAGLPNNIYHIKDPGNHISFFFSGKLEDLKEEGLENRAELKSLKIQEKISKDMIEIAKSDYWPTVSAEGVYSRIDQDPSPSNDASLSVGLSLNFSLFDGGFRRAGIKEALSQKRQAKLAIENLSKQIAIEIEQVYLELITHQSTLKSLKDQLEYAKENYNAVEKQFKYGLANSVDVMDANNLLVTSQKQLSESRYLFQLALLKMEQVKGTFLKKIDINH